MARLDVRSRWTTTAAAAALFLLLTAAAGNVAARGFRPWSSPGDVPSPLAPAPWRFDQGECRRERIGGALGGLIGGVIGSRITRHSDGARARVATTAFGSLFGYVIGSQIGRSMDRADGTCRPRPPGNKDNGPPPVPGGTRAIRI